jgi:very-short-patch-repair endonuclease
VNYTYNDPQLKQFRRDLRKSQTEAETILWYALRNKKLLGFKFFRQYSVENYILDFYCPKRRLGIEVDGGYHKNAAVKLNDMFRTEFLADYNIKVIRFWNEDVIDNLDSVLQKIKKELIQHT